MRISDAEHGIIENLMTQPDRELAQKIMMDIFRHGSQPDNKRLAEYIRLYKLARSYKEFDTMAAIVVNDSDIQFSTFRDGDHIIVARVNKTEQTEEEKRDHATRSKQGEAFEAV